MKAVHTNEKINKQMRKCKRQGVNRRNKSKINTYINNLIESFMNYCNNIIFRKTHNEIQLAKRPWGHTFFQSIYYLTIYF